jgi:hypothetical protein
LNEVQLRLSAERQACHILKAAGKCLAHCKMELKRAISDGMNQVGLSRSSINGPEYSAMANAQSHAFQAETFIRQARNVQPAIQPIGNVNPEQGNFTGEVLFDNIFAEYTIQHNIKIRDTQVIAWEKNLTVQLNASAEREKIIRGELDQASKRIELAKRDQQKVRSSVFGQFAEGLPEYQP